MRTTVQTILLAIGGSIAGAIIFGTGLAIFFMVYIRIYGNLMLSDSFYGATYVHHPLQEGFIFGAIAGILPGLFAGALVGYLNTTSLQKGAGIGLIALGAASVVLYLLFEVLLRDVNSYSLYYDLKDDFPYLLRIFLIFIIPAMLTGTAVTAVSRLFSR
jgi:ABC-type uncharacterized transport system permease subunit